MAFSLGADLNGWAGDGGSRNPTLTVNVSDQVTLTISWVNSLHNWALYPGGTSPANVSVGSAIAIARTADVHSGSPSASVTFTLSQAGVYEYFCEYHPYSMHGQLIVHGPNRPPTLTAIAPSATVAAPGTAITFAAEASDPDGDVLTFAWDYGDGTTTTGTSPPGGGPILATHTFQAVGLHVVGLTVRDPTGGNASASIAVSIEASPPGGPFLLGDPIGVTAVLALAAATILAVILLRRRGQRKHPG